MGKLTILSTGSVGNAYILECDGEQLLIELGISWKEILKGLNYDISNVVACLASHIHQDHLNKGTLQNAIKGGLSVYSCQDAQTANQQVKVLENRKKTALGGFLVQPIPLEHSCENIGFLIEHKSIGKLVFCTDCTSIPYKFKNVNQFVVEANNDSEYMLENALNDEFRASSSENHMEINDTIDFLKNNISSQTQNIILIHLSTGNIHPIDARKKVQNELSFSNVYVAKKNEIYTLETCEF